MFGCEVGCGLSTLSGTAARKSLEPSPRSSPLYGQACQIDRQNLLRSLPCLSPGVQSSRYFEDPWKKYEISPPWVISESITKPGICLGINRPGWGVWMVSLLGYLYECNVHVWGCRMPFGVVKSQLLLFTGKCWMCV